MVESGAHVQVRGARVVSGIKGCAEPFRGIPQLVLADEDMLQAPSQQLELTTDASAPTGGSFRFKREVEGVLAQAQKLAVMDGPLVDNRHTGSFHGRV